MKLRNSIKYRLLEPIILLVIIATISIGTVAFYAYEANIKQNEIGARAVKSSNHAQTANQIVGKLDKLVQETLDMVMIKSKTEIFINYDILQRQLTRTIEKLETSKNNEMIQDKIFAFEKEAQAWLKNARILLGIDPSTKIPTRFAFTTQTKIITAKASKISTAAENIVNNHSSNSHDEFQSELVLVSALTIGILSLITMLLLARTKSFGTSMSSLSDSMAKIVEGKFNLTVKNQDRQDEVGKMARHLSKFAKDLSQLDVVKKEKFLLSHDTLTGLANRSLFSERLEKDLKSDHSGELIIALIDLDNFKLINDNMGHDAGDALLTEVAARLNVVINKNNGLVARFGGDEFAIIAYQNDSFRTPEELGEIIMSEMAIKFQYNSNVISPSCSIGFITTKTVDSKEIPTVLKAADVTLYEAKAAGKSCFQVYNNKIKALHERQDYLASILPYAIKNGEIDTAYQPKICLNSGTICGVEALARWHFKNEQINTEEFIAIAERIGMIRELDIHVLREASKFSMEIFRKTGQKLHISSNMSAQHFRSGEVSNTIRNVLEEVGLEPEYFTLEITESSAVENWDTVVSELTKLKSFGVKTSIDDFGTGYSSLSYLQRFQFDEIKIDKEFIGNINKNEDSHFLFSSIVNMAKGLGSRIVVEGIETQKQGIIAKQLGAHIGQGYLFGKPLKAKEMNEYVNQIHLVNAA